MSSLRLIVPRSSKYRQGDLIDVRDQKHYARHHSDLVEVVEASEAKAERAEVEAREAAEAEQARIDAEVEAAAEEEALAEAECEEEPPADKILDPGQKVEASGQYVQIAGNNRVMLEGDEWTLVEGEPAPPTMEAGWRWKLVDATK